MKTLKRILFLLVLLFTHYILFAQTCNGITFSSPGEPNTCTYTYTNFGWENQFGNSIPTLFDIIYW